MNHAFQTTGEPLPHPSCDRATCHDPVEAFLLFDPRETSAWIRDYDVDSRTVGIGLCHDHADRVTVPVGWDLEDQRGPRTARLASVPNAASSGAAALDDEPEADADVEEPVEAEIVVEPVPDSASDLEGVEFEPTLWADDEPETLRVDESTPLLSRAFRAAHIE